MLQLYNTLTRRKQAFEPLEAGKVSMYVCGMTVYDFCHVGHALSMVTFDLLYRHLLANGYEVRYVRNITDIDDKIIARAAEAGEPIDALTERFIDALHEDERALDILPPTDEPRATQFVKQMVAMIVELEALGLAYAAENGDVYFKVAGMADYGKLSGRKLDELRAGERVAVSKYKQDPLDFVLWKAAKADEPSWPSTWGGGRPGWHIECSAMSRTLLGEQFDIHGGGFDLIFPHHENEIAQSEACSGKAMANYWLHNGFVRVDDEKMSKSLGNFFTVRDVLGRFTGEEVRYFIVASHYRSALNYSDAQLLAARASLKRLYGALRGHAGDLPVESTSDDTADTGLNYDPVARFDAAMNDDLNTPDALAVLFDLAGALNRETRAGTPSEQRIAWLAHTLRMLGARLGLLQQDPEVALKGVAGDGAGQLADAEVDALILARQEARAARDFERGDALREQLTQAGIVLEDAGTSTTWRRG